MLKKILALFFLILSKQLFAASSCQYALAIGKEAAAVKKAMLKMTPESLYYNYQLCQWAKDKIVPRMKNFAFHINIRNQKGKAKIIKDRDYQDFTIRTYNLTKEILKISCKIEDNNADSSLMDAFNKLAYHTRYMENDKCSSVQKIYRTDKKNDNLGSEDKSAFDVGLDILDRMRR